MLEKYGLFDETMRLYGNEDREFWLRICKHYDVQYIEEPLVGYRILDNSLSRSRKLENIIQGRYLTIEKIA